MPEFRWFNVPEGEIKMGRRVQMVPAFDITFAPISIEQYSTFLRQTDHRPVVDRRKRDAEYYLDTFRMNFGTDPFHAAYGVTHNDAVAYCNWAGVRLPTDVELARFFVYAVQSGQKFVYAGRCWTSDGDGRDRFITRDGPYARSDLKRSEKAFRETRHRRSCELDECVRVVRVE